MNPKEIIANRIGKEISDGDVVNLGIGLPTMVSNYIPDNIDVTFHSENGIIGLDQMAIGEEINPLIVNAGAQPVTVKKGSVFFDSAMSFALIRGGHIDVTVLGALEVDEQGNLANYMVPNKMVPGMGGAMDLVTGAKKVIVAMLHTAKGSPKILKKCTLPLTGKKVVDLIVTELAVFKVTENGLLLKEIHQNTTVEDVIKLTDANIKIDTNLKTFV